jgi:bacterioferritin
VAESSKSASVIKATDQLLNLLNEAIARELQVAIQYMWQHIEWSGIKGYTFSGEVEKIAIAEMKHAEAIAERLFYLGGTPTTKPNPIFIGANLKEMISQDIKDEAVAISLYRQIIDVSRKEGDETTNDMFRDILSQEESHHDTFTTLIEGM